MPPKVDFIADNLKPDFTPDDPSGESFNLNDVVKLKPYQMAGFVNPEDITTGPNQEINPITKRDNNEGFWSKALNLPEARKPSREDEVMFKTGINYGKVGEVVKKNLPEGKVGNILGGLATILASTPEAILSDPTTPAMGLLGAGKIAAPRAELKTRLENIKALPAEEIAQPSKLNVVVKDGKLAPRKLVTPEELAGRETVKALEGKPIELSGKSPIDFVPDSAKVNEPTLETKPVIQPERAVPSVVNDSKTISDSVASRLQDLFADTEGSLKPKELVENAKKTLLKLRGKTPDEVATIRQELVDALSNKRRIDTGQLYSLVEGTLSKRQFERVLIDLLDSGEIQKSVKRVKPAYTPPVSTNIADAQTPEEAVDILMNNIKSHTAARIEQDQLVSAERKARINEASKVTTGGMEGYFQQLSKLKGRYPAVKADIQNQILSPQNVDVIRDMIVNHPGLSDWDKIGAQGALAKVAGIKKSRGALQPSEIADLQRVFGERATQSLVELHSGLFLPKEYRSWEGLKAIGAGAKSLKASTDFPGIFRAGINYAGQKEWRQSVVPALKSYFSDKYASNVLEQLKSDPIYQLAHDSGLAITDYRAHNPLSREEAVASLDAEKIPLLGKAVSASNRGQTVFADVLRLEKFKSLHAKYDELYKSMAKTAKPEELAGLEELNPANPYRLETIADEINVATGRGKLPGRVEAAAHDLNVLFFSPRLMSARMRSINRVLNPVSYIKYNKIQRQEALKQLLSISSIAGSTYLAGSKLGGYEVGTNPLTTDFGKMKKGDTRVDPLGGYQQIIVPAIRLLTGAKVSGGGKLSLVGDYGAGSGVDLAEGFLENKASPFLSFAMALANRQEMGGKPLNFTTLNPFENTATRQLAVPMITQDLYELFTHEPDLAQKLAIVPSSLGMSIQTYNKNDDSKDKLIDKVKRDEKRKKLAKLFGLSPSAQ